MNPVQNIRELLFEPSFLIGAPRFRYFVPELFSLEQQVVQLNKVVDISVRLFNELAQLPKRWLFFNACRVSLRWTKENQREQNDNAYYQPSQ
jgi:hypothetical protein